MADVSKTIILRYDVDTKKLTDANGKAVTSIKQLIGATQQAAEAQQKMGDVMGKNSQLVLNSAEHIQKQISYARQQRQATATNSQEWEKQTAVINQLEGRLAAITNQNKRVATSQVKTAQTTRQLSKLQENQARSAGLAGAATFELGRTISDMPFGLVAVSNNISQLGTLMAALVANAKGVGNALRLIGAQIMGPAGILIAFQVVTAAITYFAQSSSKAKKEAVGLSSSLREEAAAIEMVTEKLSRGNVSLEQRLDILERYGIINKQVKEDLKEIGFTEEETNELLEKKNELIEKRAALEAAREISESGDNPEEVRAEAAETLFELETKLFEERRKRIEVLNTARRMGNLTEERYQQNLAKINNDIDARLLKNAGAIERAKARIRGIDIGEVELKGQIFDLEKEINDAISDRIKLEEKRQKALEELFDARMEQESELTDEAVLEKDLRKFKTHYHRLLELKKYQLEEQKKQELEGVTDQTTINAIEAKYSISFKALNKEFADRFKEGIEEILDQKIEVDKKAKIGLLDLIDGPEKTEAEKWAEKEVKIIADAVTSEFQKRVASQGERNWFVDTFGVSEADFDLALDTIQQGLSVINDVFSAEAEREIAIETNRTNALNDQLRQRLANEQMSADERDKINQQIARNEAELVVKENAINKKRFEQQKAFNIAMAVVDTFVAANQALRDQSLVTTFAKVAAMISIIGTGLANVAMISKQQFTAKAMPRPNLSGQGTSGGGGDRVFNVVGATPQTQIAEAIAAAEDRPVKAYVVSSDVTSAQELDRRIVEGASI